MRILAVSKWEISQNEWWSFVYNCNGSCGDYDAILSSRVCLYSAIQCKAKTTTDLKDVTHHVPV